MSGHACRTLAALAFSLGAGAPAIRFRIHRLLTARDCRSHGLTPQPGTSSGRPRGSIEPRTHRRTQGRNSTRTRNATSTQPTQPQLDRLATPTKRAGRNAYDRGWKAALRYAPRRRLALRASASAEWRPAPPSAKQHYATGTRHTRNQPEFRYATPRNETQNRATHHSGRRLWRYAR
jgi:hypothetical protein